MPLISYCDYTEKIEKLGLVGLKNDDEIKYALMPTRSPTDNSTLSFVTLGIGKDITAEKAFRNVSFSAKDYGSLLHLNFINRAHFPGIH